MCSPEGAGHAAMSRYLNTTPGGIALAAAREGRKGWDMANLAKIDVALSCWPSGVIKLLKGGGCPCDAVVYTGTRTARALIRQRHFAARDGDYWMTAWLAMRVDKYGDWVWQSLYYLGNTRTDMGGP